MAPGTRLRRFVSCRTRLCKLLAARCTRLTAAPTSCSDKISRVHIVRNSNGVYTRQVRSFDIVDDGANLSITNVSTSTPDDDYRRRDLNIFPVLRPESGGPEPGLLVLSGVFTPTNGAWTVPVEIDANGNPTMDDPTDPSTFKQGFNGYHSAKLGLYSAASGEMHEVLFGGISLQFRDEVTGNIETDNNFPFVNDISSVMIDADGNYSQHHLGYFPVLEDLAGNRIRFGANSEFLPVGGTHPVCQRRDRPRRDSRRDEARLHLRRPRGQRTPHAGQRNHALLSFEPGVRGVSHSGARTGHGRTVDGGNGDCDPVGQATFVGSKIHGVEQIGNPFPLEQTTLQIWPTKRMMSPNSPI